MKLTRTIPPLIILAIASISSDAVPQAQIQQPPPQPQSNYAPDAVSVIAILLSGATATFAIVPKLLEKWFGGAIEARQNKNDLHTLITKSQAELELDEKRKELESANSLADFYLESAREGRKSQEDLLKLFVTKELDRAAQANEDLGNLLETYKQVITRLDLIDKRLDLIDKHCRDNGVSIKDIFAVLQMHEKKDTE